MGRTPPTIADIANHSRVWKAFDLAGNAFTFLAPDGQIPDDIYAGRRLAATAYLFGERAAREQEPETGPHAGSAGNGKGRGMEPIGPLIDAAYRGLIRGAAAYFRSQLTADHNYGVSARLLPLSYTEVGVLDLMNGERYQFAAPGPWAKHGERLTGQELEGLCAGSADELLEQRAAARKAGHRRLAGFYDELLGRNGMAEDLLPDGWTSGASPRYLVERVKRKRVEEAA